MIQKGVWYTAGAFFYLNPEIVLGVAPGYQPFTG